jgi:hypothetical protein
MTTHSTSSSPAEVVLKDNPLIPPPPPSKTKIQNRRLTYLNRSEYTGSATVQERLYPYLYKALILRHSTPTEKLDEINTSKSRSLTNVLLDAQTHMDKLQARRDRTEEERTLDDNKLAMEQAVAEMTPKEVLADRDKSRLLLEKMVREKFLEGGDDEFDYESVDFDDVWDDWEIAEEDIRAKYFEEESTETEGEDGEEKVLSGQTGVQDF